MLDFTFVYATPMAPMPVPPLPPRLPSASSQGSPQVIAPYEDPTWKWKHCFWVRRFGTVRRRSVLGCLI
jgi:hypothetical protein